MRRKREGGARSNGFAPCTAAQARVGDAAQQTSAGRLHRGCDSAYKPQQHSTAQIIAGPDGPTAARIIHTRRRAVTPALPERIRVAGDGSAVTLGTSLRPRHPQRSASDPHVRARNATAAQSLLRGIKVFLTSSVRDQHLLGTHAAPDRLHGSARPAQIRAPAPAPRRGSGPAGRRPQPRIARAQRGGAAAAPHTARPAPPRPSPPPRRHRVGALSPPCAGGRVERRRRSCRTLPRARRRQNGSPSLGVAPRRRNTILWSRKGRGDLKYGDYFKSPEYGDSDSGVGKSEGSVRGASQRSRFTWGTGLKCRAVHVRACVRLSSLSILPHRGDLRSPSPSHTPPFCHAGSLRSTLLASLHRRRFSLPESRTHTHARTLPPLSRITVTHVLRFVLLAPSNEEARQGTSRGTKRWSGRANQAGRAGRAGRARQAGRAGRRAGRAGRQAGRAEQPLEVGPLPRRPARPSRRLPLPVPHRHHPPPGPLQEPPLQPRRPVLPPPLAERLPGGGEREEEMGGVEGIRGRGGREHESERW